MARIFLIGHDHWAGLVVLVVGMSALLSYRFFGLAIGRSDPEKRQSDDVVV